MVTSGILIKYYEPHTNGHTIGLVTLFTFTLAFYITFIASLGEYKPTIPSRPLPMFTDDMIACVSTYNTYTRIWELKYYTNSIDAEYHIEDIKYLDEYTIIVLSKKHEIYDINSKLIFVRRTDRTIKDTQYIEPQYASK